MSHILTLISDAAKGLVDDNLMSDIASFLALPPEWQVLAPSHAAQIKLPTLSQVAQEKLRARYADTAIDLIITTNNDKKQLLVADMESTIIEQECLDELADKVGIRDKIADITERAMRGELEFEPALRERVKLLQNLPITTLEEIYNERVTLMPGAQTLIATLKQNGTYCALVSGGFTFYAQRIAELLGFDFYQSNNLGIQDERLDGTVIDPILGRSAKAEILEKISETRGLALSQTIAVGDGSNDLAMIDIAGFGVAFRAKPAVAAAANICVNHGDLTALLYIQGYRKADFAKV
ncbi:phosphoserine phosphatase SerB [Alphaproteobacteria bacterium]|nr:phosphoserine phosphatase SerB [Alphaproteobacteria bacterium]